MTKNRKAVLMHSPAMGLWFYIGARSFYSGVLNSSSKRTRRFPPPGFVCACVLAHAFCSWCQISGSREARTDAMTHWDFGKHLEGHRAARAGQARGALALPQCCPVAPWSAGAIYKPKQALLHPHKTLPWEGNSVGEAVRRDGWLGRGVLDSAPLREKVGSPQLLWNSPAGKTENIFPKKCILEQQTANFRGKGGNYLKSCSTLPSIFSSWDICQYLPPWTTWIGLFFMVSPSDDLIFLRKKEFQSKHFLSEVSLEENMLPWMKNSTVLCFHQLFCSEV